MSQGNPHQHTDEWWRARRGKLTSSRIKTVVNGSPRGWLTFMQRLRIEIDTPNFMPEDLSFIPQIARGHELEPVARANAEMMLETDFELVGFVQHASVPYVGCSSDFLAYDRKWNGEIKCFVKLEKHMMIYHSQTPPAEYYPQMQCQMAVQGVEKTLFVSYHPEAPHWKMKTVILEVPRDETYIRHMLERCEQFMAEFNGEKKAPVLRSRDIPSYF